MTLEERKAKAMAIRAEGYNCAQSVLMAFDDALGMERDILAQIGAGLGLGCSVREICGVVSAMAIAEGLRRKAVTPKQKGDVMNGTKLLASQFMAHNGHLRCASLKGVPGMKPCNELILDGVEILHKSLGGEGV